MINREIANYILSVILQNTEFLNLIAYQKEPSDNAITIIQSDFFDDDVYLTRQSYPVLPLDTWHETPLLFGKPKEEIVDGHLIIYADVIASSFFLMSRYEEIINFQNKDKHGRFMGKNSLPGKAAFLDRPVIDEYGEHLRKSFREIGIFIKRKEKEGKVYLTHDVDLPWKKWEFFSALRSSLGYIRREHRLVFWPILNFLGNYKYNPLDSFEWILQKDQSVKDKLKDRCEVVYFLLGTTEPDIYTESYIEDKKIFGLIEKIYRFEALIGLHIGYTTGKSNDSDKIIIEKKWLKIP